MFLWLFCFSTSEDKRNCVTAEELILCREADLILHCSLLPRHQDRNREQGGETSQASLAVVSCSTRALGCWSCMSTAVISKTVVWSLKRDLCQGRAVLSCQVHLLSLVSISFFSMLFYFFSTFYYHVLPARLSPYLEMEMFWLHPCCTFELLTPLQIGCMHRKHFVLSVRVCAHVCCSLCACI